VLQTLPFRPEIEQKAGAVMKTEKFPRGVNLQDNVRKLRILAENNPSVHESESATAKAEELQARLDSGSRSRTKAKAHPVNDAKRTLPRGIRRRGDALVISFCAQGSSLYRWQTRSRLRLWKN
jgi:hypothetical protein